LSTEVTGPFRALEQWIDGWAVSFPADASPQVGNCFDDYMRFKWTDIQDDAGNYKWALFDQEIHQAIDARRKFHFAIIPMGTTGYKPQMVGGGKLTYPLFAHNKMQAEPIKDWIETPDNFWVPNWNSASYLTEWEQVHTAVASHIAASSYKGVAYATVIGVIEINGYGNWGEWHNYPWTDQEPANVAMTGASAKRVRRAAEGLGPRSRHRLIVILFVPYQIAAARTVRPRRERAAQKVAGVTTATQHMKAM
jgi:hypothetical protein